MTVATNGNTATARALDGLAAEQVRWQVVERGGCGARLVLARPRRLEAARPRVLTAAPAAAAARAQVLQDHLHVRLARRLRKYGRVTQHAVVQRHLRLRITII